MGLFKKKEKEGVQCPACGSFNISMVKGTQPVVAYPGFFSGVSNNSPDGDNGLRVCKKCKNVFSLI
jgi:hypothetical protein